MPPSDDGAASVDDYQKALSAYRGGNLDEAQRLCRRVLQSAPDYADAMHLLGVVAFEKGDNEQAVKLLTKATDLNPNDASAFASLGAAHRRTKNSAKAIGACHTAIALDPGLVNAHFQIGLAYQSQRAFDEAEEAYRRALSLDPDNARIYDALGTALHKSGRLDEAVISYRRGLALNPKQASLHNNLASALQKEGDLESAEASYLEALSLAPKRAELHCNLGFHFERRNRFDQAFAKYQAALELDPGCVKAQLGLARIHEACNELQQAVTAYQRAIRLDPRTCEAHTNLGRILVDAKKFEEARVCYENVLRIDLNDAEANEGLGDIHKELGEIDQAIGYYRRASALGSIAARHLLAALTGEETRKAPRQYVEELFDSYSEDFDEHLVETLTYEVPKLLYEAFTRVDDGPTRFQCGIDLGCGTGLAGLAFQSVVDRLDGVDLSPEMLTKARKKAIYTDLSTADIVDCLNAGGKRYDLFIATDVLIYIGDLTPLFSAVQRRAANGAYFLFSIENTRGKDFELQSSGRYAHSEAYIRILAQTHRFAVLGCRPASLRKEDDVWVKGTVFVLKYAADAEPVI